jgi:TolB protein
VLLVLLVIASQTVSDAGHAISVKAECGRILVVRGRTFGSSKILSVRADGRGVRSLSIGFDAVWSPNGRQLVVQRIIRGGRSLHTAPFLAKADGSKARRLTHSNRADYWPAWTADGKHVVFSREQRPNRGYLFYAPADLWEVNVRTGGERRLTSVASRRGVAFMPSPGPQGSLVFSVIRAPIRHDPGKPGADLYLLNRAGRLTRLVADPASDSVGPSALSPDGRRLVFFRRGQGIFVLNMDNKRVARLTQNRSDSAPGWSPDGRRITFTRGDNVYVMNADGTGAKRIFNGTGPGSWAAGC